MNKSDLEIKNTLGSISPLVVLNNWLKEALKIPNLKDPWAMNLSTSQNKRVSSRIVLLKEINKDQLFFYTNYLSAKGRDIEKNPQVAVCLYWPQLGKQIRIEGRVTKPSRKKSIQYWKTRNRESQLSQWISNQSQKVSSKSRLQELKNQAEQQFYNKEIPCPLHWGAYAIRIKKIEFWKNQDHRLHDRILFEKKSNRWVKQKLFP